MSPTSLGPTLLVFGVGFLVGLLCIWIPTRITARAQRERLRFFERRAAEMERAATENQDLRVEVAELRAERRAEADKAVWMQAAEQQMRASFHDTADRLLRHSTTELAESSRLRLASLVEPLQRQLGGLDQHVRQLEKERQGAYDGLLRELDLMRGGQESLRRSTQSLAATLKAPGSRGRWGEIQLRRLVEMAGLLEWVDFTEQPTLQGGLRPDLVVHLPGGRNLPVDAKTPMSSFLAAAEESDPVQRRRHLDEHLKAVQQRVAELSARAYWQALDGSPDFVVMFMPNESILAAAYERQPDFLERCMEKKVLPATPVSLLAVLRSVAWSWRRQSIAEDAAKIAALGRELHDRWALFDGHLRQVGKSLDSAVQSYNRALGSVERRLLPTLRRLEDTAAVERVVDEPEPVHQAVRGETT